MKLDPAKTRVYCLFEQSGTFKRAFMERGFRAYDYDIQNNFGETDHVIDLFAEIERGYGKEPSVFDRMGGDDLIMAFFPCIYFTGSTNPCYYRLDNLNYRCMTTDEKFAAMIERSRNRQRFYELLYMMCGVVYRNDLRMVLENPFSSLHYLHNNFLQEPSIIDRNRSKRGDYFRKPTGYWFFNCEPTHGFTSSVNKNVMAVFRDARPASRAGLCSEGRSMISPEYARNFIADFILGSPAPNAKIPQQGDLF